MSNAEQDLFRRPAKADGTDAARGILASVVFIDHFTQIFVGDVYALGIAAMLSVLFFFAISGFVISDSLIRHTTQKGSIDLMGFAKRRFFRVMPPLMATFLLIVALELVLVLSGVLGPEGGMPGVYGYHLDLVKVAVSLLTFGAVGDLGGGVDGPLWSLRYEIRCYLTAAVVMWLLTSRAATRRKAIVFAGLCIYWFVALFIRNEGPISQLPWLLSFAAGFAVFRYRNVIAAAGSVVIVLSLALSGAACVLAISKGATNWYLFIVCLGICGCAFAPVVLALHGVEAKSRVLAALGRVSYTLYIAHFPILLALYLLSKAAPAGMYVPLAAGAAFTTAITCFAMGRAVERPAAQLAWTQRTFSHMRAKMGLKARQA